MSMTGPGRRHRAAGAVLAAGLGLGVLAGCATDENAGGGATQQNQVNEENPFIGLTMTVRAEVARVLGPQAFTLQAPEGQLLVIAQQPNADLQENTPVAVTGTVRQAFDLPRVENEFGFDVEDGPFEEFEREPYLVATAVDTTTGGTGAGTGGTGEQPAPTTTGQPAPTTTGQPAPTTEGPSPTPTGQPAPTT